MELSHLYDYYSPIGDMITCITCVVILAMIFTALYYAREKKFGILKEALHFILLGSFTNILFYRASQNITKNVWVIYVLRDIYHLSFLCCIYLFLLYMKKLMGSWGKGLKTLTHFTRFLFVLAAVMDVLSPFTKAGLHREGNLWYDPMVSPYNAFYAYAVLLLLLLIIICSKRMIKPVRRCLILTGAIDVAIMAKSAFENVNVLTSYTYIIPILVVMILLHSKPFDDVTGSLSADSFDSYIHLAAQRGTTFDYMVLQLNMNVMDQVPLELGKIMNSFWHKQFKNAVLFNLEHDLFVLIVPRIVRNGATEEKIRDLLTNDFKEYYSRFQIQYKLLGLFNIDFLKTGVEIRELIHYMLFTMDDNTIVITDEALRDQLRLMGTVRHELIDIEKKNDKDDPRVLAYCQPIRNMTTGKFDTAEALMRLSLDGIGIVPPNLFIPLAEYYGHIHSLSRIMLHKVCKQVKELEEQGYEFSRISVNVVASEIRMTSFCDEILEIAKQNGINTSHLGIEITESQNESDFNIVKNKMQILQDQGIKFYLDDVGTGYSNLDRIVKYDIDVVKFDRFFLLEAEKNARVIPMMQHLSQAFKDLNYKLLFEGVESEEHEQLCMNCGADYIQGFKYSKPVPIHQLTEYFERA